ncbi:MAG: inorganic pyrophosphatase [Candidatus Staskawiczbacteria bacterium RIFCSPHIGHO2_02_FULL_34_9]|uniref:Inorganic pyrophosphatase n=1 Tax=Candidatus Staskawiczbacteria bacterium RIFCSPHIGHO2_02_FULL_34_9 TaxID=1802206 RepID=A0A1G2HZH9_9BACT|nr:MAG: inorganic pyrophosphatase [Candidatus Staskawiczbacteria bacterium RIFCSPHIGHO2_02_FULL_34_9]
MDVIIEIPRGSRNKYEVDKKTNSIRLDRVLYSSVQYPADYGYLENTLCGDGDPLDVLVITRFPTFPGCVIGSRPIAVLNIIDTGESDEKIIAVPENDPYFDAWKNIKDMPEALKNEIEEFFKTYKNLQKGKTVEVKGWGDAKEAEKTIKKAIEAAK